LRTTLENFLDPVYEGLSVQHPPEGWLMFIVLAAVAVLAGLAGIAAAYLAYNRSEELWVGFEAGFQPIWGIWREAYGVDDIYGSALVAPGKKLAEVAAFSVDNGLIDGAVNGVGRVFRELGARVSLAQTGQVRSYAAFLLAGTIAVVIWLVAGGM
jgi:NADH-quinone oxidoreductase subunit L